MVLCFNSVIHYSKTSNESSKFKTHLGKPTPSVRILDEKSK